VTQLLTPIPNTSKCGNKLFQDIAFFTLYHLLNSNSMADTFPANYHGYFMNEKEKENIIK